MNKQELQKYVSHLDDNVEIIVINKDQTGAIPKHCERIEAGGKTIWVLRKLKGLIWAAFLAWVLEAPLDNLPKPEAVFVTAASKIEYVMTHTDYNFSYRNHDNQYPHIAYVANDATYFIPPSGLSPEALVETGSFGRA